MAVLTVAQRQQLEWVFNYVNRGGSGGRILDTRAADELARVFQGTCGFKCGCGNFQQELKYSPMLTFLRLLLCPDGLVVPTATGEVVIDGAPIVLGAYTDGVFLGTACSYGVLSGQSITNTGLSVVQGDLGVSPGTSVTGFPPGIVTGTQHINDAAAAQAQLDLTTAYNEIENRANPVILFGDIGGRTLSPGLYKSTSSLAVANGALTLDGQGNINSAFVFQIASTLTFTAGRQMFLVGGAQARNVFFQVGSSATFGTTSVIKGTVLALTSITAQTGAAIEGRLLARNGSVTLDTNSIVVPPC